MNALHPLFGAILKAHGAPQDRTPAGASCCPICGKNNPHHHTAPVVDAYQNKRARQ